MLHPLKKKKIIIILHHVAYETLFNTVASTHFK